MISTNLLIIIHDFWTVPPSTKSVSTCMYIFLYFGLGTITQLQLTTVNTKHYASFYSTHNEKKFFLSSLSIIIFLLIKIKAQNNNCYKKNVY